jgi:iron complex outermembrane receptor protein
MSERIRHQHFLAATIAATLLTAAAGQVLAQTEAPVQEKVLPKVKVSETATENAYGPVQGYLAKRSGSGTKTDTPIIETPQSISVVTADQIRATNSQNLQDALVYTAGVATGSVAASQQIADTLFLRGFQADNQFGSFYRDGMRYQANISNGKQEPYGLERVEYLKGPASILYGTAAPGGIINTVSKRPQAFSQRELNLEFGNFERRQVSADATGPIDSEGTWLYRLTGLAREAETFVDFGRDDRMYVAPALTWRPTEDIDVTLLTNYQKSKQSDPGTLPLNATLLGNPNGDLPRATYLGEPNFNKFDTEIYTTSYLFEYRISDTLRVNNRVRYYDGKLDNEFVLLNNNGLLGRPQQSILSRQARRHDDETTQLTSDTSLQIGFATGPFEHTFLAGIDTLRSKYQSVRLSGTYGNIDAFNPVRTNMRTLAPMRVQTDNRRQTGVYLQDQIKFRDKLVLLVGGRRDFFQNEDVIVTPTAGSNIRDRENDTSGRAGLVYLFDNGLAPFVADYRFDALGLPELSFGVGVRYSSRKPGNTITDSNLEIPSFTISDARLIYGTGAWRFAANVFNLTDKKYIASNCIIGVRGCSFGEPRKITASVSYSW